MQAYNHTQQEPWTESRWINQGLFSGFFSSTDFSSLNALIGSEQPLPSGSMNGGQTHPALSQQRSRLQFKQVDAYGHPAQAAFEALAQASFSSLCDGQAEAFFPYYVSQLDALAWRWNVPEGALPEALLPGTQQDLGSGLNHYGPIYPRHGFMISHDPLKAAVLAAFRAVHFITRLGQPHVYTALDPSSRDGYWPAGPLEQTDKDTGLWQMLYPKADTRCQRFPYGSDPLPQRRSLSGQYLWNFWKAYECCQVRGQILVFHSE